MNGHNHYALSLDDNSRRRLLNLQAGSSLHADDGCERCCHCAERWPCDRALLLEGLRLAAEGLRDTLYACPYPECGECGGHLDAGGDIWKIVHDTDCATGAAEQVLLLVWDDAES